MVAPFSPASISVVVPAYCSESVGEVVDSVSDLQSETVVVVDSSPEEPPQLGDVVRRVWSSDRMNPATARNRGAELVHSDYILFLDSDVVLTDSAREFVRQFLVEPDRELVAGVYRTDRSRNNVFDDFQNAVLRYRLLGRRGERTRHGSTSHLLVRRDVFEQVGGFNPELETDEDIEFSARCLKFGYLVHVDQRFEATHLKRFSAISLLRDNALKAHDAFLARRRYPGVYRGFGMNLGPTLWATLVAACLLPLAILTTAVGPGTGIVGTAVVAGLALSPLMLWPSVLRGRPRAVKALGLVVWPAIAWVVAGANLFAAARWFSHRTKDLLLGLLAWTKAGCRVVSRNGMPVQIVHFITSRCNLRCEHCFYKETLDDPNPGEISLETLDRTTQEIGPVLWYSLAGGEPFLRGDLVDLIDTVQERCRPRVFSIPTNGWFVERTFQTTLRALQRIERGNFILFLSLDGPEKIHDAIRGEGSFAKARECIDRLRPLQNLFPNLYLNVITTVMPQNVSVAPEFINEIVRDFRPNAISINLFRHHSLNGPPLPHEVLDAYDEATKVYEEHLLAGSLEHFGFIGRKVLAFKEVLKSQVISRIAREDVCVTPCTAGTLSYVINEDGTVAACEILDLSQNLGSITGTQRSGIPLEAKPADHRSTPVVLSESKISDAVNRNGPGRTFVDLVKSDEARQLRKWIRDTECRCTYECAMTTNTLFSWPLAGQLYRGVASSIVKGGR